MKMFFCDEAPRIKGTQRNQHLRLKGLTDYPDFALPSNQ